MTCSLTALLSLAEYSFDSPLCICLFLTAEQPTLRAFVDIHFEDIRDGLLSQSLAGCLRRGLGALSSSLISSPLALQLPAFRSVVVAIVDRRIE